MSTKIFDAFRYEDSIEELMKLLPTIKEKHIEASVDTLWKFKNFPITHEEAKWVKEGETVALGDLDSLSQFLQEEARRGLNNHLNYEASAVVYFHKSKIYVQFFGLDREVMSYINSLDVLTEFWWENQTGILPDNCSQEDYDKRGEVWEEIWADSGIASEIGLIYEFWNWWIAHLIETKFRNRLRKIGRINKKT